MLQNRYLNKLRELPEPVRQLGGLVTITVIVILSFAILNIFWGGGDELVRKMKLEEERIAKEGISIPIDPNLSEKNIETIIHTLNTL